MIRGIAITIFGIARGFVGSVQSEPLGVPRNIRGQVSASGVVWTWDAPTSWGAGGRRTPTAYRYQTRIGSLQTLSAWTGAAVNDSGTVTIAWVNTGSGNEGNERMQIRVQARSADGSDSVYVASAIVTEPAAVSRGPFARAFARAFPGGGG